MTINLLAILLSLAMMMTGAGDAVGADGTAAALPEPVARVFTISNVTIAYNGQEVALTPSASFGVRTDGVQAAYDFHIDTEDSRLLPFQLVADADGLLLTSGSSGTTVHVTAGELEQLVDQQVDGAAQLDEENQKVLSFITDEFLPAYGDVIKLASDREAMQAFQAVADGIYAETVERGDGSPEQIDYEGETYDVVTYSYIMDSAACGRLCDAVYAANPVLDNYMKVYFKLIAMVSDQAPELKDIDSMEKLMALVDMRMNITESVSEADALNITDAVLQISVPEVDDPLEFELHSEKLGENRSSSCYGEFDAEGMHIEVNADGLQEDGTSNGTFTITANPVKAPEAPEMIVADAEDGEEAEADGDAVIEASPEDVDAVMEQLEGVIDAGDVQVIDKEKLESDTDDADEDMVYASMDFYMEPSEEGDTYGIGWSVDMRENSVNFSLEGIARENGARDNHIGIYAYNADNVVEVNFDANISNDDFAVTADPAKAVSMGEVDLQGVSAGVLGDAMKLYADPSVRELMTLFGFEEDEAEPDDEPEDEEAIEDEDEGELDDDEAAIRAAEPYDDGELAFGTPEFGWLPEGYQVTSVDVDTQYDMADYEIENSEDGGLIFVSFTSYTSGEEVINYAIGEDGAIEAIQGPVFVEAVEDSYRRYSYDDGTVAINLYPYADGIDAEVIGKILAGITYAAPAA